MPSDVFTSTVTITRDGVPLRGDLYGAVDGSRRPVLLMVALIFRLALTANRFLRRHRVRVHVTSSFFPHLDRNPNTGRPSAIESRLVPARQTLFHDARRPSRIVLPVVG